MEPLNRNNYEAFFLLYVDNELPADLRKQVEAFLQLNPDLQTEFHSLQATTLHPDKAVSFQDKENLFRHSAFIHPENYEAISLRYIDHELTGQEELLVEKFFIENPQYSKEFESLKNTVLPEEKIIFKDKKSLYKKTANIYRIGWKQIAAVAAIFIFMVTAWWFYPKTDQPVVVKKISTDTPVHVLPSTIQTAENANKTVVADDAFKEKLVQQTRIANQQNKSEYTQPKENFKQPIVSPKSNESILIATNKLPPETHQADLKFPLDKSAPDREKILNNKETVANDKDYSLITEVYQPSKNVMHQASYKILDTSPEEEGSVSIGMIDVNKEKVNGFFKQVAGLFGKKAKNEKKNDVQLANLKINFN